VHIDKDFPALRWYVTKGMHQALPRATEIFTATLNTGRLNEHNVDEIQAEEGLVNEQNRATYLRIVVSLGH